MRHSIRNWPMTWTMAWAMGCVVMLSTPAWGQQTTPEQPAAQTPANQTSPTQTPTTQTEPQPEKKPTSSGNSFGFSLVALPLGQDLSSEIEFNYRKAGLRFSKWKNHYDSHAFFGPSCTYDETYTVGSLVYYAAGNRSDSFYVGVADYNVAYTNVKNCGTKTNKKAQYAYILGYRIFIEDTIMTLDIGFRPGYLGMGLAF